MNVSAMEARRNFGRLLNIVMLRHEDVIIERSGKPVARLTSPVCDEKPSTKKLSLLDARGLGREIWKQVDSARYIDQERESWT